MIKLYSAQITEFTQADYTKQYSLLDVALREKIDAKKVAQDKMRSLVGYMLLHRGILEIYGKENFDITFNENGRPLCNFCFFSISHSDTCVVCAISDNNIGIDIQRIKEIKYRKKYKLFNDEECDYVNCRLQNLSERFIEIFTKKEAAVKMLGGSISCCSAIDTFSNKYEFSTQKSKDFIITVCTERKN